MVVVGEPAAAAGLQQLRIGKIVRADGAAELEALRPFDFDRRHRQEQRAGKIALGAEAGLGESLLGGKVRDALGQRGG